MPSSPNATQVQTWQPTPFTADTVVPTAFQLPAFEVDQAAAPAVRAFALSGSATIPDEVLASATRAARATGYAEGWAKGIADAKLATEAQIRAAAEAEQLAAAQRTAAAERAIDAVHTAAQSLEQRAVTAATDIEEQIVTLAWEIATALVGTVLADDELRSRSAIARALALAPADEDVVVSVSEADFAVLAAAESDDGMTTPATEPLRIQRGLRTVTITADPTLTSGDAMTRAGATSIDARLSTAMDRVREVLAP